MLGIWAELSWVLYFGVSHRVLSRAEVLPEGLFGKGSASKIVAIGRISVPLGSWTASFSSLLAVGQDHLCVLVT